MTINNAPDNKVWEVYLAEEFHKNRSDARAFCEAKGGDLLTIATQDQQTFLFDRVKFQRFWLGLSKAPDAWRWASSNQPASYTSWAVNEPQLFDGDIQATEAGLCAEFDSTSDTGPVWNSYFCDFTQPFACQLGEYVGYVWAAVAGVALEGLVDMCLMLLQYQQLRHALAAGNLAQVPVCLSDRCDQLTD